MTLPTLSKIWQISPNNTVQAFDASGNNLSKKILITVKNLMKNFGTSPWTVSGSSNAGGSSGSPTGSGAMDGVDRWVAFTDITDTGAGASPAGGVGPGRRSWIVLRQTGIATNYEICFDTSPNNQSVINLIVSPSAGFVNNDGYNRPSATDEIVLLSGATWSSGVNTTHQINYWHSNDGQCNRIIIWRGRGLNETVNNLTTFFLFDKPQNPVSGWTNPSVSSAYGGIDTTSYITLSTNGTSKGRGTSTMTLRYTGEGNTNGFLTNLTDVGTLANDFDNSWPFYQIGLCSVTSGNRGRHGNLFDLWWKPSVMGNGDTLPNDPNSRQFIAFGQLIHPWTGDSTNPLLA